MRFWLMRPARVALSAIALLGGIVLFGALSPAALAIHHHRTRGGRNHAAVTSVG